ncbi:hypothetical protein SEA_JKSYNGBOY_21 [Gordonia phage JKSyngboy]|uniref:Uncharacterized protein n=1 Tax=Gordonia phage JKSyngboy TaxID=2762400 RepID=A0A7G8LL73_9CAUD|nr:hypothetical protein J1762_gp21 [Gordonia phage JKSyngboy]QNJ57995.1 hypothetical protein SEA_JKSYNGBOY_21 [Gordonia phage JKSyngboy]WMI33032.1 hypothetical protein SEA_SCHOTTB_21 [Gordonia Phage SchottB]
MPTVLVKDGDDPGEVAAALLRAAAPDKWRVRKVTAGRRQAFEVPDDVYEAFAAEHGLDEQVPPHDPPTPTEGPGRTDDPASAGDDVTPPLVSGEPVIETGADDDGRTESEREADEQAQAARDELAGSRGEAPDRNDKTEDWQRFMRPVLGDAVDGMKRSELIAAHDNEDA